MDQLAEMILLPILLPFFGGLLCLLLPRSARRVPALISAACLTFSALIVFAVMATGVGADRPAFFPGTDGLTVAVLAPIPVFGLLVTLYCTGFREESADDRVLYAYLLWSAGAAAGAVMANDLILLLVFWGILGFTLYRLVGLGGAAAAPAAKKAFVIVGASDCLLMLGVCFLRVAGGTTRIDPAVYPLGPVNGGNGIVLAAFLCFVAAGLAKAGAMPFHSWVPDCGETAPIPVMALLPASLDKLVGVYLLIRTVRDLFVCGPTVKACLMVLGAGSVVAAVMMALVQHDMRKLLSYHAVSQVGYMVLAIGTGSALGFAAALFHLLNNTIYKTALFLTAGSVEKRTGTTDLDRLGGLSRTMPVTFATCLIASLAISGIPPLNGFASKWMVYQATVETSAEIPGIWVPCLAAAMFGSALTLASFVKLVHAGFLAPSREVGILPGIGEVSPRMWGPGVLLAALCVLAGIFPGVFPLRMAVYPAVGGPPVLPGVWHSGTAALMLALAMGAGLLIYVFAGIPKARLCEPYVGGERVDPESGVSGVDFYRTVSELPALRGLYRGAARKWFDVYETGGAIVFYFVHVLRSAHTGRLPLYLTWLIGGVLGVLYMLMRR